jgi:hypothetical protein
LAVFLISHNSFYINPSITVVNEDALQALSGLQPLFFLLENREVLEQVQAYARQGQLAFTYSIFDESYFFAKKVVFAHLENEEIVERHVFANYQDIWADIFGNTQELLLVDIQIKQYEIIQARNGSVFLSIGKDIHRKAFTDYSYTKNKYRFTSDRFEHRVLLILIANLQQCKLLEPFEACLLLQYVKYCAEQIKNISDDELFEIALDEVKGYIPTASLFGIGFGLLESVTKYSFYQVFGRQSDLITFEEFLHRVSPEQG